MSSPERVNRGPRAASENRAALIAAARKVFASAGFDAPLNAVAREAGVGQGSLYRHFPNRVSLALAVFDENVVALEELAESDGSTIGDLLRVVTDQVVVSTAFIEMLLTAHEDPRVTQFSERVSRLFTAVFEDAKRRNEVPQHLTPEDLSLAVTMLAGAVSAAPTAQRSEVSERVWALLPFTPNP